MPVGTLNEYEYFGLSNDAGLSPPRTLSEVQHDWLDLQLVTGDTLNERWWSFLTGPGTLSERWHLFLDTQAIPSGTLNERKRAFFASLTSVSITYLAVQVTHLAVPVTYTMGG